MNQVHEGGCLCGGVRYRLKGPLRDVVGCHCSQCRRTSGHFVAATSIPADRLELVSDATLRWYESSATASRGFCSRCGGNLFWRRKDGPEISVMAGTLDPPTHLHIARHIFVADKSDYYELQDSVPKSEGWS